MDTLRSVATATLALLLATSPVPGLAGVKDRLTGAQLPLAVSGPPVGVEIYLQAWNPAVPANDTPLSVLNQPSGISSRMNAAWDTARAYLSDPKNPNSVPALLSKGGLIAKGVSLYDVKFTTSSLSAITLQQGGGYGAPQGDAFTMHWLIPGTRLDFRSTTPDAVRGVGLSSALDPHLSAQLDLDITLGFAVSDRPGESALQVTQTIVHVSNPQVDSGNLSGDVIKAISDFCSEVVYGKNLNTLLAWAMGDKNIAADPQHGGLGFAGVQTIDVKQMANDQLKSLNAEIAQSGIRDALRVGLWVKSGAGRQMLALLFAPKSVPLPPQNVSLSGTVVFDDSVTAAQMPANCNSIIGKDGVVVEVQTGPRKILNVEPISFGTAPSMRLQNVAFGGGPVGAGAGRGQCFFTLSGLVDLWPNNISFPAPAVSARGSLGNVAHYIQLRPDGWSSPVAMTAALTNHNLLAGGSMAYRSGVGAMRNPEAATGLVNRGDPAYNPAATSASWGARQSAGSAPAATTGTSPWGAPAAVAGTSMAHSTLPASRRQKSVIGTTNMGQRSSGAEKIDAIQP